MLTRDPVGTSVGLLFAVPFGVAAGWFITMGGWWWAAAVSALIVALFGVVGLAVSIPKKVRDAKGNEIQEDQAP